MFLCVPTIIFCQTPHSRILGLLHHPRSPFPLWFYAVHLENSLESYMHIDSWPHLVPWRWAILGNSGGVTSNVHRWWSIIRTASWGDLAIKNRHSSILWLRLSPLKPKLHVTVMQSHGFKLMTFTTAISGPYHFSDLQIHIQLSIKCPIWMANKDL